MVGSPVRDHPVYAKVAAEKPYGESPTRYVSCTDTAALIRSHLARTFPGTKFYVRSSSYSGGSSIRVAYDGVVTGDHGWPVRVLVDYDGNVLDPTPVTDPDYSAGGRYGSLPKPGAPRKRDVEAALGGYEGRRFDGMIDMAYGVRSWLNPDGSATLGDSPGTGGSHGSDPGYVYSRSHPSALLVSFGASYVFVEDFLPYDVRSRKAAA